MRINAIIAEQTQALKGAADILGKLDTGDLIRAKVLEATTGELLLKLVDGIVFRAAVASDLDAAPGETIELMVKGRNGETLVMETVKRNLTAYKSSQDDEITQTLANIGVKPDKQVVSLVSEAKAAGINISREIINKAVTLLNSFKNLTPEKAVFLISKNIDAESQNLNNAVRILEGSLQLGRQLEELGSVLSRLTDGGSFESYTNKSETGEMNRTDAASADITGGLKSPHEADNRQVSNTVQADLKGKESSSGIINNNSSAKGNTLDKTLADTFTDNKPAKNADSKNSAILDVADGLPDEISLLKHHSAPAVSPKNTDGSNAERSAPEIREMVRDMKQALGELFIPVDSEKLSSEIKEQFKEILDKLESTRQLIETLNIPDRTEITAKLQEVEEGIRLLHQFSSNNIYVQLPLNFNGHNTTAELYIYKKDKGKKRIDPQNAVVLIALDTQNLGRIESVIDVKGKNVSINFRAEDQAVINFFKENYRLLYTGLLEKGYRLANVKYRLAEEKINPANAGRIASEELKSGYTSVDLKI